MSFTDVSDIIIDLLTGGSLIFLILITICRLNFASITTKYTLKAAYVLMSCGAFGMLLQADYNWEQCLFSIGVLACFQADRRRSRLIVDSIIGHFRHQKIK